ncbi:MAG: 1-acyl-sn-glycerol-3-phosphate acyltransferase [Verrucomicrobiae bacterium]|nr:1-acyl-sn-glycerol-3-phosphate acyltransferase [Verrucomicrobiae bacterium]
MRSNLVAALVRLATGVRMTRALPHHGDAAIYFANHSSHLDFVVIWAALSSEARLGLSAAAAEDYWGRTRLRRWIACDLFEAVLIPRGGIDRHNNPVARMAECLVHGRSVLIFPEGTRRGDGEIGPFKAGLYHLARRFPDIPLVPVHLENLNRIFPRGTWLPVPLIARATFLAPLRFDPDEPRDAFLTRARQALLPPDDAGH